MAMQFKKATKQASKARVALIGPAGSGKTFSALAVGSALCASGKRVALIDSERGSASKYSGDFDFDVLDLETFSPETYIAAIKAAEAADYDVVIIDSLSHAWMGKDGALEQVDRFAAKEKGNSFAAWRHVTPMHNELVDAMLRCRTHLIVTMRAKTEWIVEEKEGRDGRTIKVPKKIGLAPVQRDGLEYEFDVVGDIDTDHRLAISKTRCAALDGQVLRKPGADLAATLRAWLSDGAPAAERPAPEPTPAPQTAPAEPAVYSGTNEQKKELAKLVKAHLPDADKARLQAIAAAVTGKPVNEDTVKEAIATTAPKPAEPAAPASTPLASSTPPPPSAASATAAIPF